MLSERDLERLSVQTVDRVDKAGGVRLAAVPGREVGRCAALAVEWLGVLFPDGIAAPGTVDDLVTGQRGLLAGLVPTGAWLEVDSAGQVEQMLLSVPGGMYAQVVWEPAGQADVRREGGHARVWHAHRFEDRVLWRDLEAGHGQWVEPGAVQRQWELRGQLRLSTGHAHAVFISTDARVLSPLRRGPAASAGARALLELARDRPVTGSQDKGKGVLRGWPFSRPPSPEAQEPVPVADLVRSGMLEPKIAHSLSRISP
jgi:hypothetical protein